MSKKKNEKAPSYLSAKLAYIRAHWFKWIIFTGLKLFLVVAVALAIYAIYLDGKVRKTFEGQRWEIPVQVFGRSEQLSVGDSLDLVEFKQRLLLKGYKKVYQVSGPGEFAMSSSRAIIYRRSFDYGDRLINPAMITVDLDAQQVARIIVEQSSVNTVEFEPTLIDRIVPESKEDRVLVGLEKVPEQLIDTLLLVEDRDYYHHHGIAPLGILRAVVANIRAGRTVQGGSTLTQQLVKNMFLTRDKTIVRKINEAIMALILEVRYSKDQLLEAYINEVYLGQHYANGIYGFGLAADFYFGKKIDQLTVEQIATLVGQIKGPSYYDPWRYPERAKERRDLILGLMFEHQYLSKNAYTSAIKSDLTIRKSRRFEKHSQPAYLQLVSRELKELVPIELKQSGIRVFTGYDELLQQKLYNTITSELPNLEKAHNQQNTEVAMLVTDHRTGEIRALAGGRDPHYAGFNRALNANRQIGSLVKPVVYLAALEHYKAFSLASPLKDQPIKLKESNGVVWQPKNYDGKYSEQTTLINALIKSLNVPTVNLGMALGLPEVADLFYQLGYPNDITLQPSILLGSMNMSPYEINQVFLPIAAKGRWHQSHAINKIVTESGEVIWQQQADGQQVVTPEAAYLINYALEQVTKEGTAKSLTWLLKDKKVAGKTGTTNDQRDSWFVGYDEQYLVTTWLGQDDNKATSFTGSSGALRLFAHYMKNIGVQDIRFNKPEAIVDVWFDNKTSVPYQGRCADSTAYPTHVYSFSNKEKCLHKHEEDKNWFERLFGE